MNMRKIFFITTMALAVVSIIGLVKIGFSINHEGFSIVIFSCSPLLVIPAAFHAFSIDGYRLVYRAITGFGFITQIVNVAFLLLWVVAAQSQGIIVGMGLVAKVFTIVKGCIEAALFIWLVLREPWEKDLVSKPEERRDGEVDDREYWRVRKGWNPMRVHEAFKSHMNRIVDDEDQEGE